MMLTVRKYRIFLLVASLAAFTLYYLAGGYRPSIPHSFNIGHYSPQNTDNSPKAGQILPSRPEFHEALGHETPTDAYTPNEDKVVVPDVNAALPKKPNLNPTEEKGKHELQSDNGKPRVFETQGQKVDEVGPTPNKVPSRFLDDQHPIGDQDVIVLPSGKPKALPKIQFAFDKESATERDERARKQNIIRKSFLHAWNGYKEHAMGHDELKPLSKMGVNQTQFMGWGATLIDSLDTLWIMGLEDEFNEAVKEVAKIDFRTSRSEKIPLFETVIRYLGGLLSAYDLTNAKQPVLLHKATELADVLMGAFDTPNRMPIPYYYWKGPKSSEISLSHRDTVLAELGSLSMEFTRLAQLTKKNKYYDAIARITNSLEKFQSETRMPGLWPVRLDASGCKDITKAKSAPKTQSTRPSLDMHDHVDAHGNIKDPYDHDDLHNVPVAKPRPTREVKDPYDHSHEELLHGVKSEKRAILPSELTDTMQPHGKRDAADTPAQPTLEARQQPKIPGCDPQDLRHEANARLSFGIGGMGDSVYEYMPKMHALLGGQNPQYRTMFDYAMKAVRDHLLFRPMIKDEKRSILFAARQEYGFDGKEVSKDKTMVWEAAHLTCFAGGMLGLASKVFDNHKDLDIAKRLTDGCIWAYESTPAGVMAETAFMVPCDSQLSCPWDEQKWHRLLDFGEQGRVEAAKTWNEKQEMIYEQKASSSSSSSSSSWKPSATGKLDETVRDAFVNSADSPPKPAATIKKGGISKQFVDAKHKRAPPGHEEEDDDVAVGTQKGSAKSDDGDDKKKEQTPTKTASKITKEGSSSGTKTWQRKTALSHAEYVAAKIGEERLPPGYTSIFDRSYKLRPEAIESVFIMWRLTGDNYWREKGWTMFESIQRATMTDVGNAAIEDVTSTLGANRDSMESFWLAETLKYFYLLFSEPQLISLDDYVFNTEAHPFKLPKPSTGT